MSERGFAAHRFEDAHIVEFHKHVTSLDGVQYIIMSKGGEHAVLTQHRFNQLFEVLFSVIEN